VRVSVTDTGVGIAPVNILLYHDSLIFTSAMIDMQENIGKLFQGVVQFSPGTLQQGGGAGWGLYSEHSILVDVYRYQYMSYRVVLQSVKALWIFMGDPSL